MPHEDIQTVCRIRPLSAVSTSCQDKHRPNACISDRCVVVDPHSNKKRVIYSQPASKSGNTTATRNFRSNGPRGNLQEDTILTFDYVAGEEESQEAVYDTIGAPVVLSCIQGYNGTILCYGQTASGKTYTCFGNSSEEDQGLVPRALRHIFLGAEKFQPGDMSPSRHLSHNLSSILGKENVPTNHAQDPATSLGSETKQSPLKRSRYSAYHTPAGRSKGRHESTFVCKCSFYEIYQEKVYDLLSAYADSPTPVVECIVREDSILGVFVDNCTEIVLNSLEAAENVLTVGLQNRSQGETLMNRSSSRSHAVFQLNIEYTETTSKVDHGSSTAGEVLIKRTSKFRLIDLAGSERQKDTHSTAFRLKEAALINKSLSCLGRVINALVEAGNSGNVGTAFIPYRDSKLTFLLRDALGGNSKTTLLATVSPSNVCAFDTLSTLRFVNRAKCIRNAVIMNEQTFESVTELKEEINSLKLDLESERNRTQRLSMAVSNLTIHLESIQAIIAEQRIQLQKNSVSCDAWMNTSADETAGCPACAAALIIRELSEVATNTSPLPLNLAQKCQTSEFGTNTTPCFAEVDPNTNIVQRTCSNESTPIASGAADAIGIISVGSISHHRSHDKSEGDCSHQSCDRSEEVNYHTTHSTQKFCRHGYNISSNKSAGFDSQSLSPISPLSAFALEFTEKEKRQSLAPAIHAESYIHDTNEIVVDSAPTEEGFHHPEFCNGYKSVGENQEEADDLNEPPLVKHGCFAFIFGRKPKLAKKEQIQD